MYRIKDVFILRAWSIRNIQGNNFRICTGEWEVRVYANQQKPINHTIKSKTHDRIVR